MKKSMIDLTGRLQEIWRICINLVLLNELEIRRDLITNFNMADEKRIK